MAEQQEKPKPTAIDKGKGKAIEGEEQKDKDGKPVKDEKLELPPGAFELDGATLSVNNNLRDEFVRGAQ
jgi:hypothetical protein